VPPARRKSAPPPPLTDDDVAAIREQVAAGQTPRVVVRAAGASVAAGTRGSVIRLGNPKDSEYIVVRLGRDEVPFAPSELGIPGRKAPAAPRAPRASRPSRTTRTPKPKPVAEPSRRVAPVVLTLRFRDRAWTLEAQRGSKQIAAQTPLHPAAVNALADHVEEGPVRDALLETVAACRVVIEEQAAALRAELAKAEEALKAYETRPSRAKGK